MSFCSSRPIPHQLVEPPLNCNCSEVTLPWRSPLHSTTNGPMGPAYAAMPCKRFSQRAWNWNARNSEVRDSGWLVRTSVPSECATFRKSPEMVQATTCLNIEISHLIKHSSNVIEAQQFLYTSILSSAPSRQGHHSCRRTSCTFWKRDAAKGDEITQGVWIKLRM